MGRTLDITPEGAMVEITSSIPFSVSVGKQLRLTISLGQRSIPVLGRVKRAKRMSDRHVILGIQFTELLPNDRAAISDFVRQSGRRARLLAAKRLDQYTGRLNTAQLVQGMNAALANAKRLLTAASLLREKGDDALAASMAALSIEELDKIIVLRSSEKARTDEEVAQCWSEYRSHTAENLIARLRSQLVGEDVQRLDDFRLLFQHSADNVSPLDTIKHLGFYTDCLGNTNWSIPADVIGRELSATLVRTAALLCDRFDAQKALSGTLLRSPSD